MWRLKATERYAHGGTDYRAIWGSSDPGPLDGLDRLLYVYGPFPWSWFESVDRPERAAIEGWESEGGMSTGV
jgi:hypothetical protein